MDIGDLLMNLPADSLYALAKHWEIAYRKPAKGQGGYDIDTIQALEAAYHDPQHVTSMMLKLSPRQREGLDMLYAVMSASTQSMAYQDVIKHIHPLLKQKNSAASLIEELEAAGLVFRSRQRWQDLLHIPEPIAMMKHYVLAEQLSRNIAREPAAVGKVSIMENRGLSLHHDLITILGAIANEKIEVSQKGHIYKRSAVKLADKLRSKAERFPTLAEHEGQPKQVHFLEQFLGSFTRMVRLRTVAKIQLKETERFLSTHYAIWSLILFEFYLSQTNRRNKLPLHMLSLLTAKLGYNQWVPASALGEQLDTHFSQWNIRITPEQIQSLLLDPWIMLGLIQWGQDEQGNEWWQWTAWGREFVILTSVAMPDEKSKLNELMSTDLFVQPNMEIMLPENSIPAIRWKVEALAELKQADAVLIYEITKKRIVHALECGWTLDSIREFLNKFSKVPVADNVYQTIKDWIGNYGVAKLWDVMVLQVSDPTAAEWMRTDKLLSKLITAAFSEQSFVIRRSDEREVRERLAKLGYPISRAIVQVEDKGEYIGKSGSRVLAQATLTESIEQANCDALAPQRLLDALTVEAVASHTLTAGDADEPEELDVFDELNDDEDDDYWVPY